MSPDFAALRFDPSQEEALDRIHATLSSRKPKQFILSGFAGTGKTLVIREGIQRAHEAGLNIGVCSFTGKATDVLRRKGVRQAQTLHSLMYEFQPDTRTFRKKSKLEVDAVVVDEASTINRDLYEDLKSFQIPIVWVGDHGQLEPIGDNPNIMANPDLELDHIYRQAEGSAILDVAHAFREGLPPNWKAGREVSRLTFNQAMECILDFDIVLCGKNVTRHNINRHIRRKKGYVLPVEVGETIVCLRNNRDFMVFNGMLLKVTAVHRANIQGQHQLDLEEVGTGRRIGRVQCKFPEIDEDMMTLSRDVIAIDYGACLTVAKAQGSEFGRVLVFEERGPWDRRRWTYTAATRAAKHLSWTV
jgi:exodeoxyribonuclease V